MVFPPPQYLQLYPTTRCNQGCDFCFNSQSGLIKDMSPADALGLLDIMLDHGILDLDIMGGEPFLLPWMPSFLHAAIKEGIMVNISTNGSFPEVMEEFRGLSQEKINIGISLEGSSAQTHNRSTRSNNYDKAVASISSLVSMGLNPVVKTVVNSQVMTDIQEIIAVLKQLGVNRYYLIHRDLFTANRQDREEALSFPDFMRFFMNVNKQNPGYQVNRVNASCFEKTRLPGVIRCAGGVCKLSVMPDGAVYPCNLLRAFDDFFLGNIFTEMFSKIWSNPKLGFFRNFSGNRCSMTGCSNHSSCTGGCPAHALLHRYELHGMDIRCLGQSSALDLLPPSMNPEPI